MDEVFNIGGYVLTYVRIGHVTTSISDGITMFSQQTTDLSICSRCGTVVAEGHLEQHANWHAQYSLERWDDN